MSKFSQQFGFWMWFDVVYVIAACRWLDFRFAFMRLSLNWKGRILLVKRNLNVCEAMRTYKYSHGLADSCIVEAVTYFRSDNLPVSTAVALDSIGCATLLWA